METILVGMVVLMIAAGGGAFYFTQEKASPRTRKILHALGLSGSSKFDDPLPFYRWGWHEDEKNRVSAEQMVRDAFRKEGLWLNSDDLDFFKMQCEQNIQGDQVDTAEIEKKVAEIASRSDILIQWTAAQIRAAIEVAANTTPNEAQGILLNSEINSEADQAQGRLLALELKRQLCRIGAQILGPKAKGFFLNDSKSGKVFLLQSIDAWRSVLISYKDEIERLVNQGKVNAPPPIPRGLNSFSEAGALREYLRDLERHAAFRKKMMNAIQQKEIAITPDRIATLDAYFYSWKFTEGVKFEQDDHDRIRGLLTRNDLSSRFREIVIEKIGEEFRTLTNLANLFSRKVLIYGGSDVARSFATDQYSRHLAVLLECIANVTHGESAPPIIIEIPQEEIETMRRSPKKGASAVTLDQVMEKYQRIVLLRESIAAKDANKRGWIINLALSEPTPEEIEAMRRDPFKRYTRFNCDNAGEADFLNNTYNAQKSRVGFLNMVIDCLVEVPSLPQNKKPSFGAMAGD